MITDRQTERQALAQLSAPEQAAYVYAAWFHRKQLRKYVHTPYRYHLLEVASLVKQAGGSFPQVLTAIFHDLLEDTALKKNGLWQLLLKLRKKYRDAFLPYDNLEDTFVWVQQLTDKYTPEAYPCLNREERKTLERHRFWSADPSAMTVKFADVLSNTSTIIEHDPAFAKVYLQEKSYLLNPNLAGDQVLLAEARLSIEKGIKALFKFEEDE